MTSVRDGIGKLGAFVGYGSRGVGFVAHLAGGVTDGIRRLAEAARIASAPSMTVVGPREDLPPEAIVASLEARVRQQTALARFGQRALDGTDLAVLMDEAVALVAETLNVEYAKILELLGDGKTLLLRSGIGWAPGLVGQATVGTDRDSQAGYTLLANRPVIVYDLRCESRFSGPSLLTDHGVVSGMSVVLHGRHQPFGVFGVHTTRAGRFTAADADFLQAMGNVVATAIERRTAESQFSDLLESAPDAIVVVDDDGTIRLVNSQAEAMFGYRREELLGQGVERLVPHRDRSAHLEARRRFLTAQQGRLMNGGRELSALRKGGAEFPVEISLSPVGTSHGTLVYCAIRDITERKQISTALRERIKEVEESRDRIASQSRELQAQAEQLTQARDAALAAAETKSQFLANMSHEIRAPMNGIFGMVELLSETPLSGEQREFVEFARRSATGLLRIIDDILDFSKIEAGAMTFKIVDFDLAREVAHVEQIVSQAIAVRGLEYRRDLDPRIPNCLRGDPVRLRQVLVNLLGNAVKFTKQGYVSLQTTVVHETPSQVGVEFRVVDTGIGISARDRGRLFQSFLQLDGSLTREYEGTGLGLAISKRLVEAMGGSIAVESVEGRGSTFSVTMPFERAPAGALRDAASA